MNRSRFDQLHNRGRRYRYRVTFYQCGVYGLEPEYYRTKAEANRAAVEFLQSFRGALKAGHRYSGSIYRDGYARIVHGAATEALAEVHKIDHNLKVTT